MFRFVVTISIALLTSLVNVLAIQYAYPQAIQFSSAAVLAGSSEALSTSAADDGQFIVETCTDRCGLNQSVEAASTQKCKIQPTFINLYPNEYSQELHYYPFVIKLDR